LKGEKRVNVNSLQELVGHNDFNSCFGCGSENTHGLKLKSYWNGKEGICRWRAEPHHKGFEGLLNGGIIATLIDCHSFWTGLAASYHKAGIPFGAGEPMKMVTRSMTVKYLHAIPVDAEIELRAYLSRIGKRSRVVVCSVNIDGKEHARGEVTFVLVV
jgi:acyl-coenzyme A thioesterase PaaI-like protein